jgi:hypothetical protein
MSDQPGMGASHCSNHLFSPVQITSDIFWIFQVLSEPSFEKESSILNLLLYLCLELIVSNTSRSSPTHHTHPSLTERTSPLSVTLFCTTNSIAASRAANSPPLRTRPLRPRLLLLWVLRVPLQALAHSRPLRRAVRVPALVRRTRTTMRAAARPRKSRNHPHQTRRHRRCIRPRCPTCCTRGASTCPTPRAPAPLRPNPPLRPRPRPPRHPHPHPLHLHHRPRHPHLHPPLRRLYRHLLPPLAATGVCSFSSRRRRRCGSRSRCTRLVSTRARSTSR